MSNTFPYTSPNNLNETSFRAGSQQELYFAVYDSDGNAVNVSGAMSRTWRLSYYGDSTAILSVDGTTGSATNIIKFVISGSSTASLEGKFIQQYQITDSLGVPYIPSQGLVNISPKII
jgi:hypothetical protein